MADIEKMWDKVQRLYAALGKNGELCLTGVAPRVELICLINRNDEYEYKPLRQNKTVEAVLQSYIDSLTTELRSQIDDLKQDMNAKIARLESILSE